MQNLLSANIDMHLGPQKYMTPTIHPNLTGKNYSLVCQIKKFFHLFASLRISLSGTSQIFFIKYNKNSFQSVFNADPMPVWCCQYTVAENWRFHFGWVEIFWNNLGTCAYNLSPEVSTLSSPNLEGSGNNIFNLYLESISLGF